MSEEKQDKPAAAAPATAAKPPKKLQPRVAPKPEIVAEVVAKVPATKKPVVKKPSKLDETKARNKKALAEALAKAQAVQIPPPAALPEIPKAGKPAKAKKVKLVRHSISMP